MPETVYLNGDFVPKEEACLSPTDRGFLFSDGIYEALCSYEGRLFLADEHFARLQRSLQELRLETDLTAARFAEIARTLVRRNGLANQHAKVYLQVTRGAPPTRQHAFPTEPTAPTVYATAGPYELPEEKWTRGVKVLLCRDERWGRCDIKSVSLLPNVLANQRAMEADAFEAVLVRPASTGEGADHGAAREAVVTEGSHSTVAAVVGGEVVTHPLGPAILPSVTRGLVLKLARREGIPVREEPVSARQLPEVDELFLLGTTTGVMPVTHVESGAGEFEVPAAGWAVADGTPGPVTRRLQDAFRAVIDAPEEAALAPASFLEDPAS